jgi:hypothetical protein
LPLEGATLLGCQWQKKKREVFSLRGLELEINFLKNKSFGWKTLGRK